MISELGSVEYPTELVRKLDIHQQEVVIASVVWHELKYGLLRMPNSRKKQTLEGYLNQVVDHFPVLDYDCKAANWHASERARLSAKGQTASFVDGQIAAIAYVNNLTLVTSNLRHFRAFADLRIESW